MKRFAAFSALALLLLASAQLYAQPGPKKMTTIKGEILDMGCWTSRALTGTLHRECGLKCLAMGIPMGLMTADSVVYLLTQNHDRAMTPQQFRPPDPYGQCKGWVGYQVEVTGYLWQRKGTKMMEVREAKLLTATTAAAAPKTP